MSFASTRSSNGMPKLSASVDSLSPASIVYVVGVQVTLGVVVITGKGVTVGEGVMVGERMGTGVSVGAGVGDSEGSSLPPQAARRRSEVNAAMTIFIFGRE